MTAADLAGVHVALATPIADGKLDPAGMERLLVRVTDGGAMGICPTGSTGEGPRLTRSQRREVTAFVRSQIGPHRLLIPAASAMAPADVADEISGLADAGADAVLLAPPSYYPMDATGVVDWYRTTVAEAVLPIILYNIPSMTAVPLPATAVAELAALDGVVGIKDSSRDFEYLQAVGYATADSEFAVLTGSDSMLLPSLQQGAVGTIAASANLVPQLSRRIYDCVGSGDLDGARIAQQRLYQVIMVCRTGTPPAGWKAALAWAGVCERDLVPPAAGLDAAAATALSRKLSELDLS